VANPKRFKGEFLVFPESHGGIEIFLPCCAWGVGGDTSPMKWLAYVNIAFTYVNVLKSKEIPAKSRLRARSHVDAGELVDS
jgi:hypothetical protein